MRWYSPAGRCALLAGLLALAGCGKRDGLSDYERKQQSIQKSSDDLATLGAKIETRSYPQGQAKAVTLTGVEVNESVMRQIKSLGNISELNLSKTSFNDSLVPLVNELDLFALCLKLDLSHTGLTDEGFQKLQNLRLLGQMNLTGTKVTREAVQTFKQKRLNDPGIMPLFRKPTITVN
jgi:hypothetical protein